VTFAALLMGAMLIMLLGADELLLFKLLRASTAKASCANSKLMPVMPASRLLRMDCTGGMALALVVVLEQRGRLIENCDLLSIMLGALQARTAPNHRARLDSLTESAQVEPASKKHEDPGQM
jgi:hypothetical protein